MVLFIVESTKIILILVIWYPIVWIAFVSTKTSNYYTQRKNALKELTNPVNEPQKIRPHKQLKHCLCTQNFRIFFICTPVYLVSTLCQVFYCGDKTSPINNFHYVIRDVRYWYLAKFSFINDLNIHEQILSSVNVKKIKF